MLLGYGVYGRARFWGLGFRVVGFRVDGLEVEAHKRVYHSALGSGVIKKKKKKVRGVHRHGRRDAEHPRRA